MRTPISLLPTPPSFDPSSVTEAQGLRPRFSELGRALDLWLHRASVDLVAVDADQAEAARAAYRRYGRGRHRAGLNYGDCFSYALAKVSGQPLLFKGDDFGQTDIVAAKVRAGRSGRTPVAAAADDDISPVGRR